MKLFHVKHNTLCSIENIRSTKGIDLPDKRRPGCSSYLVQLPCQPPIDAPRAGYAGHRTSLRCGELLRVSAESGERATADKGRPPEVSHDATHITLTDLGLTRDQSSRYQKLAAINTHSFS